MLIIRDLHVKFHTRDREAVAGVSLTVGDGEIFGLVGESGSGKTVTAMAASGLLDRTLCSVSGEISLDGTRLDALSEKDWRAVRGKRLGVVFQDPFSAFDPLEKAGKQAGEALAVHASLSKAEIRNRVLAAFSQVELSDPERVYESYPHELSGGMLQRVTIAAALLTDPALLFLDEPTTALDVSVQAGVLDLLRRLNRERGTAMLFISHDLRVVKAICTRVAVMQKGKVVETGDPETVFTNPTHPYTRRLAAAAVGLLPENDGGLY